MKKTIFFVLAFALLATACNSSGTVSPTVVSTPTEIPSVTPLPSATPIPSATPTATPNLPFVSKCPDVVSEMPSNADGVIVLNGNYFVYDKDGSYVKNTPSYLWNIKTGTKTSLLRNDGEELTSFVVSPDHRLFAYFAERTSRTIIAKADGQLLRIITDKRWFSNYGWSEDNWLLVNYLSPVRRPEFYILAFNPLTSETETFIPDFPNMAIWGPAGWNVTESSYDPSLTLVVYGVGANLGKWVDIVLWDIQVQQEIVRLKNPSGDSSTPVWSPDGKRFVVDISPDQTHEYDYDELFSVSRDGVIQRLTFLTDYYEEVEIRDYSWSPDSRQVAFWYIFQDDTAKINRGHYLAIYDSMDQKVTSYCVRRGENALFSLPIWSPESDMLLVDGFLISTETGVSDQALLLDILNNQAFVVASDVIPVGWLVSTP